MVVKKIHPFNQKPVDTLAQSYAQRSEVDAAVAQVAKHSFDQFSVKESRLVRRSGWERFCYAIGWGSTQDDADMSKFLLKMHLLCENNIRGKAGPQWQETVKAFYFRIIAKTGLHQFNRGLISTHVQDVLSPELGRMRQGKRIEAAFKAAEAQLASTLGVKPKRSKKGVTGAVIYYDLTGKEAGIFKAVRKGQSLATKLRHFFGRTLWGFDTMTFYCRRGGNLPDLYSEIATSAADEFLNLDLTPSTDLATLDGKTGSFMVWIHGGKAPIEYIPPAEGITRQEAEKFQEFAFEDYLIGNLDRHKDNWFYREKNGHIVSISAIDNANAFTERNPSNHSTWKKWVTFWIRRQQYQWRLFPMASIPFSPQIKARMRSLTPVIVDKMVEHMKKRLPETPQREDFFSRAMLDRLYERAQVLRKVGQQENFTPRQLAALYSDTAIQSFLNKA